MMDMLVEIVLVIVLSTVTLDYPPRFPHLFLPRVTQRGFNSIVYDHQREGLNLEQCKKIQIFANDDQETVRFILLVE